MRVWRGGKRKRGNKLDPRPGKLPSRGQRNRTAKNEAEGLLECRARQLFREPEEPQHGAADFSRSAILRAASFAARHQSVRIP